LDGSVHTFSYDIASVDKIAAAIQQRWPHRSAARLAC
jgi:hypothetical protein